MDARGALINIRSSLLSIGYSESLVLYDYKFDSLLSNGNELSVNLAAFAQYPPSYRNACIGVLLSNGRKGESFVSDFCMLGSPLLFEISGNKVNSYKAQSSGVARKIEEFNINIFPSVIEKNKNIWSPDSIFRAKCIPYTEQIKQYDFIDAGLISIIKSKIREKLSDLIVKTIKDSTKPFGNANKVDTKELFRLIFRLIAAKVFRDRNHTGPWSDRNGLIVANSIQNFYGDSLVKLDKLSTNTQLVQHIWDAFCLSFNFQNLSVDDLAFIYENTLVQKDTRAKYSIHSTPPNIAELLVDRLPFETIPLYDRYVLEPCSGAGTFLIAAMRRLKDLLPRDWSKNDQHEYLRKHLSGIEIDSFAVEICRLGLLLADYPNPNGWDIVVDDIFSSDFFNNKLEYNNIILCNPPYEDFSSEERHKYSQYIQSPHKPQEILHRIINRKPPMFSIVLPRSVLFGKRYSKIIDSIARHYNEIETISLPDNIFEHSTIETSLITAFHSKTNSLSIRSYLVNNEDRGFL